MIKALFLAMLLPQAALSAVALTPKAKAFDLPARVLELESDYADVAEKLKALKERQKEAEKVGTPLKVHKQIAKEIFLEQARLDKLDGRLQKVMVYMELKPPKLKDFDLVATHETYVGESVTGVMSNGQILALRARVPHPDVPEVIPSDLFWQVFGPDKKPIKKYNKTLQAFQEGGVVEYKARFPLQKLANGRYTASLTHQIPQDPENFAQGTFEFEVFTPVRILKAWVSDQKDGTKDFTKMKTDQVPHFYVSFVQEKGVEDVETVITAKDADSNTEIVSLPRTRKRKGETLEQKTGLRIAGKHVRAGRRITFEATLKAQGGTPQKISKTLKIEAYPVTLLVPRVIESGKDGQFRIRVPSSFKRPYKVDIDGNGLLLSHAGASLNGRVSGLEKAHEDRYRLAVKIQDAQGREGRAEAWIRVLGKATAKKGPSSSPTTTASLSPGPKPSSSRTPKPKWKPSPKPAGPTTAQKEAKWIERGKKRLKNLKLQAKPRWRTSGCWASNKSVEQMMKDAGKNFEKGIDEMMTKRQTLINVGSEPQATYAQKFKTLFMQPIGNTIADVLAGEFPNNCVDGILSSWERAGWLGPGVADSTRSALLMNLKKARCDCFSKGFKARERLGERLTIPETRPQDKKCVRDERFLYKKDTYSFTTTNFKHHGWYHNAYNRGWRRAHSGWVKVPGSSKFRRVGSPSKTCPY